MSVSMITVTVKATASMSNGEFVITEYLHATCQKRQKRKQGVVLAMAGVFITLSSRKVSTQ